MGSRLKLALLTLLHAIIPGSAGKPPPPPPSLLRCDASGQKLTAASGSGKLVGSIDASPTNDLFSVSVCKWTLGYDGASTKIWDLMADGDPTSSYLVIYGAFERLPLMSLSRPPAARLWKDSTPHLLTKKARPQTVQTKTRPRRCCAFTGAEQGAPQPSLHFFPHGRL